DQQILDPLHQNLNHPPLENRVGQLLKPVLHLAQRGAKNLHQAVATLAHSALSISMIKAAQVLHRSFNLLLRSSTWPISASSLSSGIAAAEAGPLTRSTRRSTAAASVACRICSLRSCSSCAVSIPFYLSL